MTPIYETDEDFYEKILAITHDPVERPLLLLLKVYECYRLHRYISIEFDCICEELTWGGDLVFNTEVHTHKDLYNNLFKLQFNGVQLGQL